MLGVRGVQKNATQRNTARQISGRRGETLPVALFVTRRSIYKKLLGHALCYDADRDARTFCGAAPVIAHPPCAHWSARLDHFCTRPIEEKWLAYFAIEKVRENGGVLEHPAYSRLWLAAGLPPPGQLARDRWGGFTVALEQGDFGHKCPKPTWIYVCGRDSVLAMPRRKHITTNDAKGRNRFHCLSMNQRKATPPKFAQWLIKMAQGCAR